MTKMWSGRFVGGTDPQFEQWQRSFSYDRRLLPYEVAASKIHAEALFGASVLTRDELAATLAGLDRILSEGVPADDDPAIEDVHHFVEKRLVEIAGEVGLKLHTGRSRNEQIATDLRLFLRDHVGVVRGLIAEFIGAFVEQASAAGDAVMPAYTHMQRAEPVLVAHWLLAYAEMFARDLTRLEECADRASECPLGSAAIAGTILPLDRHEIATKLGFDRPTRNSMDATSDRDFVIEFVQACALLANHLSRWADEMVLFSTQEYGFVRLPDAYATGSSAMPQKKNPDAMELIRGKAGRITGLAVSLLMTTKGLPLAYNKDLQETQQTLFETADQMEALLAVATGFMRAVEFDFARMRAAASTGCVNAMSAAAYLVRTGVPFREAHAVIGAAVRVCVEKQCELEQLNDADFAACGINADAGFYDSLKLENVIACHDVAGGTAHAQVASALREWRERVSAWKSAEKGAAHACA
jgi:argininosuccinate lyase